MTTRDGQGSGHVSMPAPGTDRGEVLISGLDTGPRSEDRENLSPTDTQALFLPPHHPAEEPTDEDG